MRKAIGLSFSVPAELEIVPGPARSSFHAVERRNFNQLVGELDLSVISPGLIMDRDGVLREAAIRAADSFVAAPRAGYIAHMGEIELPGGVAWRAQAFMERGKDGRAPALPYQTVLAMGHPDLALPVALFISIHSVEEQWAPATELLESLRFLGAAAARAREAVVLPFTS